MPSTAYRACAGGLCLTILALATATADAGPVATPNQYSLTVYDPSFNIVYQAEQPAATVDPNALYEIFPAVSITVGATSYLLPDITIFAGGAIEFPDAEPTAIYGAGGDPINGPWDAIFGLIYGPSTQTWNNLAINYFLGFAAGPPGTGTPYSPSGATVYASEASGPFFSATLYLNPSLQRLGYTADFYDPASIVPEPSSLALTVHVIGAVSTLAGARRLGKSQAKIT